MWEGETRPYLKAVIDAVPNQVWDLSRYSLAPEKAFREFIKRKQGFNEETWNYFRWSTETSLPALNTSVRKLLQQQQHPLANFRTIQNLQVVERARSGRVQRLRVTTDKGVIDLTKDEILLAFDAPNSLLFYVEPRFQAAPPISTKPIPTAAPSAPSTVAVPTPMTSPTGPGNATGAAVQPTTPTNTPAPTPQRLLKGLCVYRRGAGSWRRFESSRVLSIK